MAHHIIFDGPLGSGKTLAMSIFAHNFRARAKALYGHDIQLFSNYELAESAPLNEYHDWYGVAEAHGSICCWDEAHMSLSNRKWSGYGQGIATEVMMYVRKMRSVQMYATQNIAMVDTRIRAVMEIHVRCRKNGKRGFIYDIYDYQAGFKIKTLHLPMSVAKRIFKLNLYDTYAMVRSMPLPKNEREGTKFWDTLEEIHDKVVFGGGNVAKNERDHTNTSEQIQTIGDLATAGS